MTDASPAVVVLELVAGCLAILAAVALMSLVGYVTGCVRARRLLPWSEVEANLVRWCAEGGDDYGR